MQTKSVFIEAVAATRSDGRLLKVLPGGSSQTRNVSFTGETNTDPTTGIRRFPHMFIDKYGYRTDQL